MVFVFVAVALCLRSDILFQVYRCGDADLCNENVKKTLRKLSTLSSMRWFVYFVLSPIIVRLHLHTDMQILQRALEEREDERDNVEEVVGGGSGDEKSSEEKNPLLSRESFEWFVTNA